MYDSFIGILQEIIAGLLVYLIIKYLEYHFKKNCTNIYKYNIINNYSL